MMSLYRQQQCEKMLAALKEHHMLGMTRKDFAELLGIKKGQHLNKLLLELTTRDLAVVKYLVDNHNRKVFLYFPNDLPQPSE